MCDCSQPLLPQPGVESKDESFSKKKDSPDNEFDRIPSRQEGAFEWLQRPYADPTFLSRRRDIQGAITLSGPQLSASLKPIDARWRGEVMSKN
jgi:hypothetical protein